MKCESFIIEKLLNYDVYLWHNGCVPISEEVEVMGMNITCGTTLPLGPFEIPSMVMVRIEHLEARLYYITNILFLKHIVLITVIHTIRLSK